MCLSVQARYFDAPSVSHDHAAAEIQVVSSPDGLSSDSMLEDHEMSEGMSSISDLEGRIPIPGEVSGGPSHASHSSRSYRISKGNKR